MDETSHEVWDEARSELIMTTTSDENARVLLLPAVAVLLLVRCKKIEIFFLM